MLLFQTTEMPSQCRMDVRPLEMTKQERDVVMKFVDRILLMPMADVLRNKCIIDNKFYKEILHMQRNHVPHRVVCEALVDETSKNCNLTDLIHLLYDNGFKGLAKELFLCYQESKEEVTIRCVNRPKTRNRRNIGEFFKHIKQLVDAMAFKNSYSDIHRLGEIMKQRISNTNDPVEKMNKYDKFVVLKAAEIDALTNVERIVSKDHPIFLEIERCVSSSSKPALSEVILYGRRADVLSTIGDFEKADNLIRQAMSRIDISGSCVELTDLIYKNVSVKLSKFEKSPHDEELRKSILFEGERGLWTLQDESDDLRLFWTKLFLLQMTFAHLGIGKFCDIVQNYVPTMHSIFEAERILQLNPLKDLEHRSEMSIAVARARLEEWKGNIEAALEYLQIAIKFAKEGNYTEDRALADYEIFLKRDSWQTYIYQRQRQEYVLEERNSFVLNSDTSNVSDTPFDSSLEHLDPQSMFLNEIGLDLPKISTSESFQKFRSTLPIVSEPSSVETGARHFRFQNFDRSSYEVPHYTETSLDSFDDTYSIEQLYLFSFEG